jgi:transposase InsO family protein
MKRVAETLGVSRSNLAKEKTARTPRYAKADDAWLLPMLREIVDERLTYGYRRACAVLNRRLAEAGQPRVNHKRVYRIMCHHGLLLARHTGRRPDLPHDGKVVTLKRNLRWCADVFEVGCESGEAVRVAFALDCCDREVMGYVATTGGVSGEMIRDLMVECVERRFGAPATPHPVEWLSDNGSCFTARETVDFAAALGLRPCFTPVRSPESNGMAEAFVKTFKRDYVYVHGRPDAATVLAQLAIWIDDYNEKHPHKGLRMLSPREFIRSQACSPERSEEKTASSRREWAAHELVGGGWKAARAE